MSAVQDDTRLEPEQLICRYQAGIWRYLCFLGASSSEADDLVQETFLAVLRGTFQQRSDHETAAYLRTVARNQLLMARRRQGRQPGSVQLELAESVWAEVTGPDGLSNYLDALRDCLDSLTERSRQAIQLFYRDEQARVEIAQQLKMKPDGIKSLLRRSRERLRECVERKVKS